MKRLSFLLIPVFLATTAFADDSIYVQVRSSKIRSAPQLWASAVAPVSYGEKLTRVKESGSWLEVKNAKGSDGFIPVSAVTKRAVVLGKAGLSGSKPDAKDVVMAGKGFNNEIEKQFAAAGAGNFKAVDAMEQTRVSDAALRSFVASGKLGGQG